VPDKELERIAAMPRVFLDGLGVGISLIDATTGHIRFANKQYCRILGYSEQELTRGSVSFLELTHPDDRERSDAEHRRLLSGEIPQYRLDKRCLRGDGNWVWVHVTARAKCAGVPPPL
jgi:PAS domain S-box-containing protein